MPALLLALALQALSGPAERLSGYIEALRAADSALVAGEPVTARQHLERALELSHRNPTVAYGIACAAARSGQKDALYWLERAVDWGWVDRDVALWDPDLESLRSDAGFLEQTGRMQPGFEPPRSELSGGWAWRVLDCKQAGVDATAVSITPEDRHLVSGMKDGRVLVLDGATGRLERELASLEAAVWTLCVAPDGKRMAGVSHGGMLRVWKLGGDGASQPVQVLEPSGSPYPFGIRVAWRPAGDRLLIADWRGQAGLWSPTGEALAHWRVRGPECGTRSVWMPSGETLLTADGAAIQIRDGATGEVRTTPIVCSTPVVALALHPDASSLVTGHTEGRAVLWDLASGEQLASGQFVDPLFPEPSDEIASIAFSPRGDRLGWSTRLGTFVEEVDDSSLENRWQSEFFGAHLGEAVPVVWNPDGSHLWFGFECHGGELAVASLAGRPVQTTLSAGGIPAFGRSKGALVSRGGATCVDGRTACMLWRRIELPQGELIQAPSGTFTGSFASLPELEIRSSWGPGTQPVDARLLERLFDPKRVRAAQAGIPIVPPKLSKD